MQSPRGAGENTQSDVTLLEVVLPVRPIHEIRRYSTLRKVNEPHRNLGLCR